MANPIFGLEGMQLVALVAIVAFIIGFGVSYTFFKQVQVVYQPATSAPSGETPTQQPQAPPASAPQTTTYDLKIGLSLNKYDFGRGETIILTGQVTDLLYNPIGSAQVSAKLLDFSGNTVTSGTFTAGSNSTYSGMLTIPYNLPSIGQYNVSVQANLGNRWSQPVYAPINVR